MVLKPRSDSSTHAVGGGGIVDYVEPNCPSMQYVADQTLFTGNTPGTPGAGGAASLAAQPGQEGTASSGGGGKAASGFGIWRRRGEFLRVSELNNQL